MRLDALEIQSFKKLAGHYVIEPAPCGITVLSGDNEAGKSTVLEALKAAFFLKHNAAGSAREAIRPLHATEVPCVRVGFTVAGKAYRLEKRFSRGGVRLEGPDGTLEADAAESALARLLTFEWPARGPAQQEQMGIAGLFWVEQGAMFQPEQKPSATAMSRLGQALGSELAAVGGGERLQRLALAVGREKDRFWHAGNAARAKGELARLGDEVAELRAALAEAEAAERAIDERLDALAAAIERRRSWLVADRVGRAKEALEAARRALANVQALEKDHERAGFLAREKEAALERLAGLGTERARLEADRRRLADEQQEAARERERLEERRRTAMGERRRVEEAAGEGRKALTAAQARLRTLGRAAERLRLARELDGLDRAAEAIEEAAILAERAAGAVAAEPVTADDLAELAAIEAEIGQRRAALSAVATRIELHPERPDAAVTLDGVPVHPKAPIELTRPGRLALTGFGAIEIVPGGHQLGEQHRALASGEAARDAILQRLAATDEAGLRRRLLTKEQQARDAEAARRRLAERLADCGLRSRAALETRRAGLRARLAAIEGEAAADDLHDEAALADAMAAQERLLDGLRDIQAELDAAQEAASGEEADLAKAVDLAAFAEARAGRDVAVIEDQLAVARAGLDDAALADRLAAARQALDRAAVEAGRFARLLADADPLIARREAELAERRVAELEAEGRKLDHQVREIEAELRGRGAKGIGDERAALAGRLALTERRHARLLAEATAWRLLARTLDEVSLARQDVMAEPLRARLEPYLRALLGNAAPLLDARQLALRGVRRQGVEESFGQLSVGTREQLAILVRLAIGDLLAEKEGESPPLILDDALVNADAVRLARMKAILEGAAARQQIIVLTCRREDYLGLDAHHLTLEACRQAPQQKE